MSGVGSARANYSGGFIGRVIFPGPEPQFKHKEYGGECSAGWHVFEAGVHYGEECTCGEAILTASNHAGQFIKTKVIL